MNLEFSAGITARGTNGAAWGGTFHKLFTASVASLAATAERLGTAHFCLKKKGYETVKFNIRAKSKFA
ncbi:MAG: hypothetical protein ACREKL_10375 [Chthoniobacterales bacterium]